jgi:hypothetical protein
VRNGTCLFGSFSQAFCIMQKCILGHGRLPDPDQARNAPPGRTGGTCADVYLQRKRNRKLPGKLRKLRAQPYKRTRGTLDSNFGLRDGFITCSHYVWRGRPTTRGAVSCKRWEDGLKLMARSQAEWRPPRYDCASHPT